MSLRSGYPIGRANSEKPDGYNSPLLNPKATKITLIRECGTLGVIHLADIMGITLFQPSRSSPTGRLWRTLTADRSTPLVQQDERPLFVRKKRTTHARIIRSKKQNKVQVLKMLDRDFRIDHRGYQNRAF